MRIRFSRVGRCWNPDCLPVVPDRADGSAGGVGAGAEEFERGAGERFARRDGVDLHAREFARMEGADAGVGPGGNADVARDGE